VTGFYGMGLYIVNPDTDEDVWLHFHHPDGPQPSFLGDRADCPLDHCVDVDLDAATGEAR
jgi:hypothetical protein